METLDRSFVLNLPAVQAVLQLESTLQESRVLNAVAKVLKSLAQPTHHDSRPPAPPPAAAAECFITSGVNAWAAQNLRAKAILEELEVLGEEDSETVGFAFVDAGTKRDSGDTFSDPGSTSAARKDPQADVVSEDSASTVSSSSSSTVASKCGNADICVDGEEIGPRGTNPVGQNTKNRDFTDHGDRKAEALLLRKRMEAARRENERLKARQICRVCKERPVELTLLPCGHFLLCATCGSTLSSCPACATTILADVKTIVS